jgi:CubicO group peptidase (beta-lactamase class C family)
MNRAVRHYSVTLLLAAFLGCHVSLGEPVSDIPDTPAGNRVRESLEVINSGDMVRIHEYISGQFTSGFHKMFGKDRLFDVYYGFYEKYQGLEFHNARESSPNKLVGVFRCRSTGSAYLFGLTVLRKPPHKIQGMTLLPLAHPGQPESLEPLTETEKVRMLDAFLDRLGKDGVFSGAALLAKGGNVLSARAYGMAWREQGEPNRIETRFNLASLNKMFTALAVAQLCEQGKLSYEDPIGKYLGEEWIPAKIAGKIQVKHLLSHTSGIGISKEDDNLRYLDVSIANKFRGIDDYKSLTTKAFLKSKPGKKYAYSNIGVHLLGPIIEKVSGDSYYDYVEKNIFRASGMHDTGFFELDQLPANTARGYVKEMNNGNVSWRSNGTRCSWKGTPAGGAYSTVGDLMKFEQALKNHSLVSPETRAVLFTPKPELNAPSYGFGFSVRRLGEQLKVGHTGGYIGINNHFSIYLDNGYTVIILSNIDLISGSVDSDIEFFITSLFFD